MTWSPGKTFLKELEALAPDWDAMDRLAQDRGFMDRFGYAKYLEDIEKLRLNGSSSSDGNAVEDERW